MQKASTTIGIIGVILLIFTSGAFFLLPIEHIALYFWALGFLLLAELILCAGLIALQALNSAHSKVFARSGITVILFLYFAVTLISVLLTPLFQNALNLFILMEIAILAASTIIILLILAFSRRTANEDKKIISNRSFVETSEKRLYDLLTTVQYQQYEQELHTVYENLKYCDKIGTSSVDDTIAAQITVLENTLQNGTQNEEDVFGILQKLSGLINQRNGEIGNQKRGGF